MKRRKRILILICLLLQHKGIGTNQADACGITPLVAGCQYSWCAQGGYYEQ